MNGLRSYSLRGLNDCGCCEGVAPHTPAELDNHSGLSAVAYRVGDHSRFKQTLLAHLSAKRFLSNEAYEALSRLQTRDDDDYTIGLLDAWAAVGDVLTFYQERIANESYLRTATERLSLLELTRLIGYRLNPGVAASTYLAFTIQDAPGAPDRAVQLTTIDAGTKVQSTPGPGQQAQIFETIEPIEARLEWNAMRPRLMQPQVIATSMGTVVLEGTTTQLKPGDPLLIVQSDGTRRTRRITAVVADEEWKTTRVDFETPGLSPPDYVAPALPPADPERQGRADEFAAATVFDEAVVDRIMGKVWRSEDLSALVEIQGWSEADLVSAVNTKLTSQASEDGSGVLAFRQRAAVFGYNAPKLVTYTGTKPNPANEWDEWTPTNESDAVIFLDNAYDEVIPGGYAIIKKPGGGPTSYRIEQVSIEPRTEYGVSSKTTRLTLDGAWWNPPDEDSPYSAYGVSSKTTRLTLGQALWNPPDKDSGDLGHFNPIRGSAVYVQSESLPLAGTPIEQDLTGDRVTLDRMHLGLQAGQAVAVTGERRDPNQGTDSEVMTLKQVWIDGGHTVLVFKESLQHAYRRDTVQINANVVAATHGETVEEILGSGNAGDANQSFTLRQPPLTHVPADTASGAVSTLEIRVNDLLWHEVPSFLGRGPEERIYVTKTHDDGTTSVRFGDGVNGARLPSGQHNVRATYRKGIGLEGLLNAGQLNQLMTRPLGVQDAINPVAAAGADDPESRDDARANAPLTVKTLDRTVSLQDYEDFTRSFAGIAKAQAIRTWDGSAERVFITVAGPDGAAVDPKGSTYDKLLKALARAGDPYVNFAVRSYRPAVFRLEAGLHIDPDYVQEIVLADVERALRAGFSFAVRGFAQPVSLSEVITAIQSVPGVRAVDVDALFRAEKTTQKPRAQLLASPAQLAPDGEMLAAELLTLDPAPLDGLKVLS